MNAQGAVAVSPPGGRSTTGRLAAYLVLVLTIATMAGFLVPTPRAKAASGANVTYIPDVDGGNDARDSYANMLTQIRLQVQTGRVSHHPNGRGRPLVYVTDREGPRYITIDVHVHDRREAFVRLYMRRSDQYIVGWRPGVVGPSQPMLRDFYALEPGLREPDFGLGNQPIIRTHQDLGSYTRLQHYGARRDGRVISAQTLSQAARTLNSTPTANASVIAPAALQMIVGIAEASRMREQATQTAEALGRATGLTITGLHMAFHNNWGRLSTLFLGAVLAGAVVLEAPLVIGGVTIATTALAAQYLLTAHHSGLDTRGKHLP